MATAPPTTTTTENEKVPSDEEYIQSKQEKGRYINSFNPNFKMPSLRTIAYWMALEANHTNLPADRNELDDTLPVIQHEKGQYFTEKTGLNFIWIGHATCLVQMDDFIFITDPLFSERCGLTKFIGPKRFRPPALDVDRLPDELSAVVISHNHFDHLDETSVQDLNTRYGESLAWFCGLGLQQWFVDRGIKNARELNWWQDIKHPVKSDVQISFCPAQHWSRRGVFDMNKTLWGGYVIQTKNHRFYFAGDTGYTDDIPIFRQIGKRYGPFDLSAIPIGAYAPRYMMEAQHISPKEAVQIHIDTKSKQSIGIHWGTWALANELYTEPKTKLAEELEEMKIEANKFITVKHGEIFHVPKND